MENRKLWFLVGCNIDYLSNATMCLYVTEMGKLCHFIVDCMLLALSSSMASFQYVSSDNLSPLAKRKFQRFIFVLKAVSQREGETVTSSFCWFTSPVAAAAKAEPIQS